jgi:VanZ family protein
MFSLLLVATPFVMLQVFLQQAIGELSAVTFTVVGLKVPIVLTAAVVVVALLLIVTRVRLTGRRILSVVIALALIALAQRITDFYFAHHFYDLQQNWHYVAYGLFAFMVYRDLEPRGIPLHRIMLITYCLALLYSSFDEAFQRHMSNRIFDISDIAKDSWGSVLGLVVLLGSGKHYDTLVAGWRQLRHQKVVDDFRHPMTLLLLMVVFSFLLLNIGSLLTDYEHLGTAIFLTVAACALFFLIFHFSQHRPVRYALLGVLAVGVVAQAYFFVANRDRNITHNGFGLTVYHGIPIPFFDVMIYPNGTFRLVDKKHDFNARDRSFFFQQKTDILLIGSGAYGKGGNGFPRKVPCQFVYNSFLERGTQVIIQETAKACETFNRLKKEGKNVLFILHNTC